MEQSLSRLLGQFFTLPPTPEGNKRKAEIELELSSFKQQQDSWGHCCTFLEKSTDSYVLWFCVSVFEEIVALKWRILPASVKTTIREALHAFLVAKYSVLPRFVTTKAAKVFVSIARIEWPHVFPNYFQLLQNLISSVPTRRVGVLLLGITLEDFTVGSKSGKGSGATTLRSCDVLLSSNRQMQLEKMLEQQYDLILNLLCNLASHELSVMKSGAMPDKVVARDTLKAFSQFISWTALSSSLKPELISIFFDFVETGIMLSSQASTSDNNTGYDLATLSVSCLVEIINRRCVPLNLEVFLLTVSQQTFSILQKIVHANTCSTTGNLKSLNLPEDLITQITMFIESFLSKQLSRVEKYPTFPLFDFLSLFRTFTMMQPNCELFLRCLDVWKFLINHWSEIQEKIEDGDSSLLKLSEIYSQNFIVFQGKLLNMLLYTSFIPGKNNVVTNNRDVSLWRLHDLDDDVISEDDYSNSSSSNKSTGMDLGTIEFEEEDLIEISADSLRTKFIRRGTEIVSLIAQIESAASTLASYLTSSLTSTANEIFKAPTSVATEAEFLDSQSKACSDMYVHLKIASTLAPQFSQHMARPGVGLDSNVAQLGKTIIKITLQISHQCVQIQLHSRGIRGRQTQTAALNTLASFAAVWLPTFFSLVRTIPDPPSQQVKLEEGLCIVDELSRIALTSLDGSLCVAPELILRAAVGLINTLSTKVQVGSRLLQANKPLSLTLKKDGMKHICAVLPLHIQSLLYVAMVNAALRPVPKGINHCGPGGIKDPVAEEIWARQCHNLNQIIDSVIHIIVDLKQMRGFIERGLYKMSYAIGQISRGSTIISMLMQDACQQTGAFARNALAAAFDTNEGIVTVSFELMSLYLQTLAQNPPPPRRVADAARHLVKLHTWLLRGVPAEIALRQIDASMHSIRILFTPQIFKRVFSTASIDVNNRTKPESRSGDLLLVSGLQFCRAILTASIRVRLSSPNTQSHIDKILSDMIGIMVESLWPALLPYVDTCVDMTAELLNLFYVAIIDNWRWFAVNKVRQNSMSSEVSRGRVSSIANAVAAAAMKRKSKSWTTRSPRAANLLKLQIHAIADIISNEKSAPHLVGSALKLIYEGHSQHSLLSLPELAETNCAFALLLLRLLERKNHELLHDQVAKVLYSTAIADETVFFGRILHQFLSSLGGLKEVQRAELQRQFLGEARDNRGNIVIESIFTKAVYSMLNDCECCRRENSSTQ